VTTLVPPDSELAPDDILALLRGYELSLRARNRSPKTIASYLQTAKLLRDFLFGVGMPTGVTRMTREHVEAFIADQVESWRPKTAQVRYGDLRQFFNWLVEEGEIRHHPMERIKPPAVPEEPVPVVSDEKLRRLLKACEGASFEERRDMAILRLLVDAGIRLGELTKLSVCDVDLDQQVIVVMGKGRRPRTVPFGVKTGQAIERYLRLRRSHQMARSPMLWLGTRGPLADSGGWLHARLDRRAGVFGTWSQGSAKPHHRRVCAPGLGACPRLRGRWGQR
jgi:site-specific recombinase XerC